MQPTNLLLKNTYFEYIYGTRILITAFAIILYYTVTLKEGRKEGKKEGRPSAKERQESNNA
jgi:hypothetical protein